MKLPLRGPLPWALLLRYLEPRLVPELERVDGDCFERRSAQGVLRVSLAAGGKALQLDGTMDAADARARITRLFALDEDHAAARRHLARSAVLAPRIARTPGLRALGCWDPFELCLRTVLGQQVTVAAAATLMRRLLQRCPVLTPAALLAADLSNMGMPQRRVDTMRGLAQALQQGALRLDAPWPEVDAGLRQLPGFGPWTRAYLAIRLGREPDAFPETDVGLIRAAGADSPAALLRLAEDWRPHRALAAIYLWAG